MKSSPWGLHGYPLTTDMWDLVPPVGPATAQEAKTSPTHPGLNLTQRSAYTRPRTRREYETLAPLARSSPSRLHLFSPLAPPLFPQIESVRGESEASPPAAGAEVRQRQRPADASAPPELASSSCPPPRESGASAPPSSRLPSRCGSARRICSSRVRRICSSRVRRGSTRRICSSRAPHLHLLLASPPVLHGQEASCDGDGRLGNDGEPSSSASTPRWRRPCPLVSGTRSPWGPRWVPGTRF